MFAACVTRVDIRTGSACTGSDRGGSFAARDRAYTSAHCSTASHRPYSSCATFEMSACRAPIECIQACASTTDCSAFLAPD